MVDFQSRDTSRRYGSDDADEAEDDEPEAEPEPTEVEPEAGAESAETEQTSEETADTVGTDTAAEGMSPDQEDPPRTGEAADAGTGADDRDEHGHSHDHDHSHAHVDTPETMGVAVVTVSSTRTREDDPSGDVIQSLVTGAGHDVVTRDVIRDDLDGIQNALLTLTDRNDVDVVVTTGGTGVTPDDITVEAARPLFDKKLPGFGELFRILSYEEVGTKAMVSRATAGIADGVAVFCLPGSEPAARLGTDRLILEEMGHLVGLARRDE